MHRHARSTALFSLGLMCLLAGCTDDGSADAETGASETTTSTESGETGDGDGDGDGDGEPGDGDGDPIEPPMLSLCGTEPPPGATLAPELPTYAGPGSCPTLETGGGVLNVMQTETGERQFLVITPSDAQTDEVFPVIFLYHWLGGDAVDFYERAEAQAAADYYRVIAIIPEGRDGSTGVPFRWPFSIADDDARLDEEFAFHDDMLACVAEQFAVDKECVSSMGVSAGAMFTAMLASRHGEHLSSFLSLSGGTGGELVKPWVPTTHHMPALVLWGGPDDVCLTVDFNAISMNMEADLAADNHFIMECVHNCTHATPPFLPDDPTKPTYATAWEFFLDHPYWLEDGESPYIDYVTATGGLPPVHPEWCAIGPGNAQIRQGECGGSEC
jgi:predicted esterase